MVSITTLHPSRFPGHEKVISVLDGASGLRAIIAIHSTALGPAFGGCRMKPYVTGPAAVRDALRLSQAMTYKAALAGLAFGGGKCVVIGDPSRLKSDALLEALGRGIDLLGGEYLTADDVGTTVRDMDVLRRVTPHARGLPDSSGEPCPAAAWGTFQAIQAAVQHRFGSSDLSGRTVAVQGLGSLGYQLCRYLSEAGAKLAVSDLRGELVERAANELGARPVRADRILSEEVDVLSPNALGDVIDDRSVGQIQAAIVAGGANNQLVEPRHGVALHRRGIVYVPDYVANAGGLIDVSCEGAGYDPARVLRACEAIHDTTARLLAEADEQGIAPSTLADHLAETRISAAGLAARLGHADSARVA